MYTQWITQYYLPPGRGDIPAFTPASYLGQLNHRSIAEV